MTTGFLDAVAEDPTAPRRSRRRLWIVLAAAVLVAAGGAVTWGSVGLRYAHAAPLECACGLGWAPPDNLHMHDAHAGPFDAMTAPARPGQVQSFYVMIRNPAPVTQTILGLQYPDALTAEPEQLAVALPGTSILDDQQEPSSRHFTSKPVSIPPQGIRWLRVSIHTAATNLWSKGREESWTDLYLRVRVGWFTRNETVHFGNTFFVLRGT